MKSEDSDMWDRARQARDRLANQILSIPAVSLIDIGYDTQPGSLAGQIVLRVYLRDSGEAVPYLPQEVDGFPVRVIHADFHLDTEAYEKQ